MPRDPIFFIINLNIFNIIIFIYNFLKNFITYRNFIIIIINYIFYIKNYNNLLINLTKPGFITYFNNIIISYI